MSCEEWTVLANGLLMVGIIFCVVFTLSYLLMRTIYWATNEKWP